MAVRRGDEFGYLDRETMRWITVGKVDGVEIEDVLDSESGRIILHGEQAQHDIQGSAAFKLMRRLAENILDLNTHLEASLQRIEELEDETENLKQSVIRAKESARQWEGNEIEQHKRAVRVEQASRVLLEELSGYYFDADDPELEAVNCLRRLVGMRDQLPKHYEAELQADEAETPEDGEDT